MYTEGIKVGNNSYVLSDEEGTLTILKSSNNQEQVEEYIKLKNTYEEERNDYAELQKDLSNIHEKDRKNRKDNIEIFLSTFLIEGLFVFIIGLENIGLFEAAKLLSFPLIAGLSCAGLKTLIYGTKKKRINQKKEINTKLNVQNEKLKELEKQINKLKENVEEEAYFWEDEIVPVTTVENKKANVKMRVLRLEQSR